MEFLTAQSVELFGAFGLLIGVLLLWIWDLRNKNRELQQELHESNQILQDILRKNIEAYRDLREMIAVLMDRK